MPAFRLPGVTSKKHDDSVKRFDCGQGEEIVAVASENQPILFPGESKNLLIGNIHGQRVSQLEHVMSFLPQDSRDVSGHIVIEKKPHGSRLIRGHLAGNQGINLAAMVFVIRQALVNL